MNDNYLNDKTFHQLQPCVTSATLEELVKGIPKVHWMDDIFINYKTTVEDTQHWDGGGTGGLSSVAFIYHLPQHSTRTQLINN